MLDVPLGTLIFRAGLLAEEQLEDALQEGMRNGKRLGEVLLERGWLHERDLGRLLAGQKGLPFVEVNGSEPEPAALQAIPEEKARLQCALPLRYEDGQLVIAVADPSNELVLENLRRTLGAEPKLVVATHGDLMRAIEEAYTQMPAAAPVPEPVAAPAPMPTSLQPEPSLQVEPVATPAAMPTPMPTVLPPAEERSTEAAEVPPLQPPVAEQAPTLEPPAVPVGEAPAPAPEPVAPVEEAPASAPEPVAPVEEEAPATLEPPVSVPEAPAAAEPVVAPLLQPAQPAPAPEPPPVAASVDAPLLETAPQPPLLTPPVEQPVETPPAPVLEQPVETPAAVSEPMPAVAPEAGSDLHIVLLRLREGDMLEVGTFQTAADAAARAQEVVRQIAAAEGEATWPFFAERYLRPDTIVSVDLVEESAQKWMGSAVRSRWANPEEQA
jgi:hypothetical protein